MQHIEAVTIAYAKSSCYRCGNTSDAVDMDAFIEGEGALAICTNCIIDALTIAKPGRQRMQLKAKRDAKEARRMTQV